jgi:stringent starvation protein B
MQDAPAAQPLPSKKDVALALLDAGDVFVHLDTRGPGVRVPASFSGQAQLVLQIGRNMRIPIPDLEVKDDGIGCTLSFRGASSRCELPWTAIYALVGADGKGMVWPDDVPPEVRDEMAQAPARPPARPQPRASASPEPPEELRRWSVSLTPALQRDGFPSLPITVSVEGCPITLVVRRERGRGSLVIATRTGAAPARDAATPYRGQRDRRRHLPPILVRRRTWLAGGRGKLGLARAFDTFDPIFDGAVTIETGAPKARVLGVLSSDETRTAILRILALGFETVGFHHEGGVVAAVCARPSAEHTEVECLWTVCSLLAAIDRHAEDH